MSLLLQIIQAQNEMIRLKGTTGHDEQRKIVEERKEMTPVPAGVICEDFDNIPWVNLTTYGRS